MLEQVDQVRTIRKKIGSISLICNNAIYENALSYYKKNLRTLHMYQPDDTKWLKVTNKGLHSSAADPGI